MKLLEDAESYDLRLRVVVVFARWTICQFRDTGEHVHNCTFVKESAPNFFGNCLQPIRLLPRVERVDFLSNAHARERTNEIEIDFTSLNISYSQKPQKPPPRPQHVPPDPILQKPRLPT